MNRTPGHVSSFMRPSLVATFHGISRSGCISLPSMAMHDARREELLAIKGNVSTAQMQSGADYPSLLSTYFRKDDAG